jgi:hypothetical protein
MWDLEVDVACLGAGIGTLASAIATTDQGADVLMATPPPVHSTAPATVAVGRRVGGFLRSWSSTVTDLTTDEYFAALSHGLDAVGDGSDPNRLTLRTVQPVTAIESTVAPFVGANLREWNARCLASQYGLLYSSVMGWRTKSVRASDGMSFEVQPVSSIGAADVEDGDTIADWMVRKVRERDVDVREDSALERIVFEEGKIVGVVLATPEGTLAVGVRHGLSISSTDPFAAPATPLVLPSESDGLQMCIVGQAASRFLHVELLETESADHPIKPMCTANGRQLLASLREPSRVQPSRAGRCGKVGGNPAAGH